MFNPRSIVCMVVVVGAFVCASKLVAAQPSSSPATGVATHPRRTVSLTISPLHLALPVVELTAEVRADDRLGLAVVGGAGKYTDTSALGTKISADVYEIGAQVRYYLIGDFRHGMQLGAEVLYMHLSDDRLTAKGAGLAFGPFVGYKVMADVGFTFDCQLGFEHLAMRASSGTDSASDSTNIPLLNINVGWSF